MEHDTVNYNDTDTNHGAMHMLRDELGCEQLGVTVVDCNPGWEGPEHEHGDEQHEEVYVLIDGEATVTVDGEDVHMTSGDAVRVPPESTRQIRNGDTQSTLVLAGSP
jgi:mannose-6-phosphate isomerase-like protein (cupin superfamily)